MLFSAELATPRFRHHEPFQRHATSKNVETHRCCHESIARHPLEQQNAHRYRQVFGDRVAPHRRSTPTRLPDPFFPTSHRSKENRPRQQAETDFSPFHNQTSASTPPSANSLDSAQEPLSAKDAFLSQRQTVNPRSRPAHLSEQNQIMKTTHDPPARVPRTPLNSEGFLSLSSNLREETHKPSASAIGMEKPRCGAQYP